MLLHEAIEEFKKLSIQEIENPTLQTLMVIKELRSHLKKIELEHFIVETIHKIRIKEEEYRRTYPDYIFS